MNNNDYPDNKKYADTLTDRVANAMTENKWMTISEICIAADENITNLNSVSAAVRAMRKRGFIIQRRINTDNPQLGKYQYSNYVKYSPMDKFVETVPEPEPENLTEYQYLSKMYQEFSRNK